MIVLHTSIRMKFDDMFLHFFAFIFIYLESYYLNPSLEAGVINFMTPDLKYIS